ncbi:MAG TPA: endonuclease/exonuclease/phosphatase family protein [Nevskiaceae bacterium]|nr:endonuclease/exonuclease/phosphatase family protein [Nevskiaceae bacterium]
MSPTAAAAVAEVPATSAALPLRLLTLNLHKGFSTSGRRFVLHELRDAIRGISADIVCLQEVLGEHRRHGARQGARWPKVPQYEFLADSIWHQHAYGRNAVYDGGHHGNAVLSKLPIVRFQNHDISIGGPERRGILHCVLQPQGRAEIHVLCTHLGLMEQHRQQQIDRLGALIDNAVPADAPLLLAGDFNDWRLRGHARLQRELQLREVFVEAQGQCARTFPARWPLMRLDRIYYRHARVMCPSVLSARPWSHLSDHVALTTELEL